MLIDYIISIIEIIDVHLISLSFAFRIGCKATDMMHIIVEIFTALSAFGRISIFRNQCYAFLCINVIRLISATITLYLSIIYKSWLIFIQNVLHIGLSIWSIYNARTRVPERFTNNPNLFYAWIQLMSWAIIIIANMTNASCSARPLLTAVISPMVVFAFCSLCVDVYMLRVDHYTFWIYFITTGKVKKNSININNNKFINIIAVIFATLLLLDSIAIVLVAFIFPIANICPMTYLECDIPPVRSMLAIFSLTTIGLMESIRIYLLLIVSYNNNNNNNKKFNMNFFFI